MARLSELPEAIATQLASDYGLGSVARIEQVVGGTVNSVFRLATATGDWFVRINEGRTEDEVRWESDLLGLLGTQCRVIIPRATISGGLTLAVTIAGESKLCSVFPWVEGTHRDSDEVTVDDCRILGAELARFHHASKPMRGRENRYGASELQRRMHRIATHAQQDSTLTSAVSFLHPIIAGLHTLAHQRSGSRNTLIHSDLFRDNVLWQGEQLRALLDFEQACSGTVAYDLAVCINDWCWSSANQQRPSQFDSARANGLIAGYRSAGALTETDLQVLQLELLISAVRFTVTRITDVYLAGVRRPDKDFRDFLAKARFWADPANAQFF